MQGGMIKCRFFSQIYRCISETVILRRAHAARQFVSIEFFPPVQHLVWLPEGVPRENKKRGKNSDFWTYALTWASYNSETIEDSRYSLRGVFQALNWLSYILRDSRRGVPRGNKNVGCSTWKRRFFALAARITGKLLQTDGYMVREVWQALNCLSIHATYCVIIAGASPAIL